jgi:small subunit ribosomal protein S6
MRSVSPRAIAAIATSTAASLATLPQRSRCTTRHMTVKGTGTHRFPGIVSDRMAATRAYDLMVLIDSDAPDDRRAAIVQDIKTQISGGGELKGDADWGLRKLAYEIDHRSEAHYHLFQLEAAPDLLNQLDRNLRINDAVLRHRIIKLPKGAPEETPRPPTARHEAPERDAEHEPAREPEPEPEREQAPEQAPPSAAEPEQQPA